MVCGKILIRLVNSFSFTKPQLNSLIFPLLGGVLMGLTPAPNNWWWLAWVALMPLWWAVVRASTWRETILSAVVWGFGYYGLALFWITGVHPMTWMGVPWLASIAIALAVWLFITVWGIALATVWACGLFFFNRLLKLSNQNILSIFTRILIGVALWCGVEAIWSQSPLWWCTLAYTQSPSNLIILQWSKLSGTSTVVAAIVAVNALLAEAVILNWNRHWHKLFTFKSLHQSIKNFWFFKHKINSQSTISQATQAKPLSIKNYSSKKTKSKSIISPIAQNRFILYLSAILLFLLLHGLGFYWFYAAADSNNLSPIRVGIIQGNVPNEIKLYPAGWRRAIEGYTEGYIKLAQQGVDLVVTPESALPFYWTKIVADSTFFQAVIREKVPAFVGAFNQSEGGYTNSLFTLTGAGETFSRYDKYRLVPLGEYIPFEPILGKIVDRLSPLEAHLTRGSDSQVIDTPFGQAIMGICYESAFAAHFRRQAKAGGEFIITASNNAHYSSTMPAQHHAQDVMRAVETDRWAARATNTGYSAFVDNLGRTGWISGIDTYETHAGTIYRRETQTPYVRWGDWLTPVLLVAAAVMSGRVYKLI